VFGICVATAEWLNFATFTLLIWIFIPFLLATRVFTIPEFLEKRFNSTLRQFFAFVTIVSNVVAFLAAVLYGGGLALHKLFGWNLWFSIIALGVVAGSWAIYGGLRAVAWTDFFTIIVMIAGGLMVTILGLYMLSGDSHSLVDGFKIMIERNQAKDGIWAEVVAQNSQSMAHVDTYNRLSVVQPVTHEVVPWPSLIFALVTVSIWYNVLNQFMIQRVLAAKNAYHARMGIVFAGYMKILMPVIVVLPGLILFAYAPEVLKLPWGEIQGEADKGYVTLLKLLVPVGLRGIFLAALFGAIQSTVNSVLNSTATVFTLDFYKRYFVKEASEKHLVRMGMWSSLVILIIAIALAGQIPGFGTGLFVYIQSLYYFFGPPFSAIFILGIVSRRINKVGATAAVFAGFVLGIAMKALAALPGFPDWLKPYAMQAIINWLFCMGTCVAVSALTPPPAPEQVTDDLTLNWKRLNIFGGLGTRWYTSVVSWWLLFVLIVAAILLTFSGLFL
jgi:SSS family solute:Na+ symporter